MPPEMRFRVIGERFVSAQLLGQRFTWKLSKRVSADLLLFEAVSEEHLPVVRWRLETRWIFLGKEVKVEEKFGFILSPSPIRILVGSRFKRLAEEILRYREEAAKTFLEGTGAPRFSNPLSLPLLPTTLLQLSALASASTILLTLFPTHLHLLDYMILMIAWIIFWFFSHGLAHYIVGVIVGIRFREYFIGVSNLCRIIRVGCSMLTLGIRVDRKRGARTRRRMAAMYASGAIASMLTPFITVIRAIEAGTQSQVILMTTITLLNVIFSAHMSLKTGDLRKTMRAIRGPAFSHVSS